MIRRDYLLRMIEELRRVLAAIIEQKKAGLWVEAGGTIDEQMVRLVGCDAATALRLGETELKARLVRGESTQVVPEKQLILAALFKETGEIAADTGDAELAHSYRLKALELLLDTPDSYDPDGSPDFIPRVETLVALIDPARLTGALEARLMYHFERTGDFARAEDALHSLLDRDPGNPVIHDFGISFYQRMLELNDETLSAGGLPRNEVEAGMTSWRERRSAA